MSMECFESEVILNLQEIRLQKLIVYPLGTPGSGKSVFAATYRWLLHSVTTQRFSPLIKIVSTTTHLDDLKSRYIYSSNDKEQIYLDKSISNSVVVLQDRDKNSYLAPCLEGFSLNLVM
jgi:tRNA uridine 5-carbamoylmethylation protein Kti12